MEALGSTCMKKGQSLTYFKIAFLLPHYWRKIRRASRRKRDAFYCFGVENAPFFQFASLYKKKLKNLAFHVTRTSSRNHYYKLETAFKN